MSRTTHVLVLLFFAESGPLALHFLIACLGGEGRFIMTSSESISNEDVGAAIGRIVSPKVPSSAFISKRLDLNVCGFSIPILT